MEITFDKNEDKFIHVTVTEGDRKITNRITFRDEPVFRGSITKKDMRFEDSVPEFQVEYSLNDIHEDVIYIFTGEGHFYFYGEIVDIKRTLWVNDRKITDHYA